MCNSCLHLDFIKEHEEAPKLLYRIVFGFWMAVFLFIIAVYLGVVSL